MRYVSTENAWLNGISLSSLDASIIVRPAIEPEQKPNITYIANAGPSGRFIASNRQDSKVIKVRFSIKGLSNLTERAHIIDIVNGWASKGGNLQISSRSDQQIGVTCIKYATPSDIISLAGVYVLEFEANGVPYWQDIVPHVSEFQNSRGSGSGGFVMTGNVETMVEFSITPENGTMTELAVGIGNSSNQTSYDFEFYGLQLASGQTMTITYDQYDILSIVADGVSVLDKRTAESADDLVAFPGMVVVGFYADTLCTGRFSARGRYR